MKFIEEFLDKLYLGDCLDILLNIPDNIIDLVIIDPPYNLKKNFPNDNLGKEDFLKLFEKWIKMIVPKLKETGSFYCFVGYDYDCECKGILSKCLVLRRELIWYYKNSNVRVIKNYLAEYDKLLYFTKLDNYIFNIIRNNVSYIYYDRYKDRADINGNVPYNNLCPSHKKEYIKENYEKHPKNIYRGKPIGNVISIGKINGNSSELKFGKHPTQKPEKLIDILIKVSSNPNDVILDCFAGSGTTLVCAKRLGRKYIGIEIDKRYYEIAKKRLEDSNLLELEIYNKANEKRLF